MLIHSLCQSVLNIIQVVQSTICRPLVHFFKLFMLCPVRTGGSIIAGWYALETGYTAAVMSYDLANSGSSFISSYISTFESAWISDPELPILFL